MRISLAANETTEIKSNNAKRINLALLSGEVNYRIGDADFADATDYKLNEDVRTDSIELGAPASIFVKAIATSVLQFRRE